VTPREVTLSWPDHPAMAEMVAALEGDVRYHIVGARFRQGGGIPGTAGGAVRLAWSASVKLRRYPLGAMAYQRVRGAWTRRSATNGTLVHCCSHLMYGGSPWIGDYENVNVLGFYSPRLLRDPRFIEHLGHSLEDPSCRAIRVWSASAERSFHALFPSPEIRAKLRVIPPAMAFPTEAGRAHRKDGPPRILFVARGFWIKGGSLFLDALLKLRSRIDFRADFVCDLPPECRHYRAELEGIVDFHDPGFSREELFRRFYGTADIFVMLGMADSYGLALLEASAFGLPIVAMRLDSGLSDLLRVTGNAIQLEPDHQIFDRSGVHCVEPAELLRRIQADSRTPLAGRIADVLEMLISDRDCRRKLGDRGRTAILEGCLSTVAMRRSMLDLYAGVMN